MKFLAPLALAGAVLACSDDHLHARDEHDHSHAKREYPTAKLTPPSRPLTWSSFNVIHTTDSHGWLLGHQKTSFPEPNYSGDFGDFASFVTHMKQIALEKDVDLLLVDSGDLHDGTGLSDGYPPGGVDAHESNKFFMQLPYDVLAIGNHELYIYNASRVARLYKNFVPHFPGRYLSSNVNITIDGVSRPVGSRYTKFKTRKGRQITSLGVLFDFTGNDVNTTVQPVADMVKESWFAEAIKEEPDLFLLVGHMPVSEDNWPVVFNAVRAVHPTTPIMIFGGHSHIRDCNQPDGRSMALESGRYMETVGWMSADLPPPKTGFELKSSPESTKNITFTRRYLDPNRVTYEYHTGQGNYSFDTPWGRSITKGLEQLAVQFDLSFLFGTAPHDFTISQAPYPSNNSVLSLVADVLPYSLTVNNSRIGNPNIMITNSGSLRFDLYAGPFDKNDQLTVSPFDDSFLYLTVPFSAANQVLPALNNAGADERRDLEATLWARGYVESRYREWMQEMARRDLERNGPVLRAAGNLTLGYVTADACPGVGDDTPHAPLAFYDIPDFIGSAAPNVSDDTVIDLVFVDFIESQLIGILNSVQSDKVYTMADVLPYTDVLATEILGIYAQAKWN
uniref:Calcineurin-like phosphoesterase domain-containing protein n=1 Tax=Mycena chlorophos TaxID=658473 RepID=A0ABQ0M8L2_MYCCL|nr:predicted protein [Mycena chlorophos]